MRLLITLTPSHRNGPLDAVGKFTVQQLLLSHTIVVRSAGCKVGKRVKQVVQGIHLILHAYGTSLRCRLPWPFRSRPGSDTEQQCTRSNAISKHGSSRTNFPRRQSQNIRSSDQWRIMTNWLNSPCAKASRRRREYRSTAITWRFLPLLL